MSSLTDGGSLYTRGTSGQTENVGLSMVQKHAEKLQQDLEDSATEKLSVLMPQLGSLTRILALREVEWDVDKAVVVLRKFVVDQEEKLTPLQKKREDIIEDLKAKVEASSSSSSDASDSDSQGHKKRGEKGHKKKKKKSKDRKKERGSSDYKSKAKSTSFGKYGIIRESDGTSKESEFTAWAMEYKKVDVELLKPYERRTLFREYMEDYNAGTLPHRKYYDIETYERKKAAKAAAKGETLKRPRVDDEEALRQERMVQREKEAKERLQQAYTEVKYGHKARDMKEQEMLRYQMNLAYKVGDRAKAQKIQERLLPDDKKKP